MRQKAIANLRHALRKHVRDANLKVINDNDDHFLGYIIDISVTGLRVVGRQPLPVGRAFHFRLEGPGHDPIIVQGKGLWADILSEGDYVSGVVFDPPDIETRSKLRELRDILDRGAMTPHRARH